MKTLKLLIAAGLISVFGASASQAFDPAEVQLVVNDQRDCPWYDLSAADFRGVDVQGVDLEGADLTDARLENADFRDVNLAGAYLTGAKLAGANLKGARLNGTIFYQVDFTGVDLQEVDLANSYCDWATKLPAESGWTCEGVIITRD